MKVHINGRFSIYQNGKIPYFRNKNYTGFLMYDEE